MKPKFFHVSRFHGVIFAGVLASATQSQAAPYSWTGLDNGTWNLGTNWSGNIIPTVSDDLTILGPLNVAGPLNIDFNADHSAGSILFTNTSPTSITNTTSGADKVLTLGSGGLTTGTGAVQIGSITANQGINLTLGAAQAWNIGAGGLTFTNSISGSGTGFTKTGSGLLTLNGSAANTFTGGLNVNRGSLNLDFANLATPTNLIDAGNALTLGGGALAITGKDSATNTSQTFNGTTLGGTINTLTLAKGTSATSATLNLGALTITPGSVTTIFTGTAGSTTWATGVTPTSEIININSFNGNALPGSGKVNVNAGLFYRQSTNAGSARWVSVDSAGQLQALPVGIAALTATTNDPTVAHQLSGAAGTTTFTTTTASSYGLVLNPSGARILALAANGTYTINGIIGLVSSASTINAGTGASNIIIGSEKNLVINMDNSGALTINAPIANNGGGASSVTIASTMPSGTPGAVTFGGVNTYTGATNISNGTLILRNASPFGTTPGVDGTSSIQMSAGATLRSEVTGVATAAPITLSGTGNITIANGTNSAVTSTFSGGITGTTGTLTFSSNNNTSNPAHIIDLAATSSYSGNTTITTGNSANNLTVRSSATNALSPTTVLTMDGGGGSGSGRTVSLDLNGNNQTLAGLNTNAGYSAYTARNQRITSTAAATLTINGSVDSSYGGVGTSSTFSGSAVNPTATIVGAISLVKDGTGTFTLGPVAMGFTGSTRILGGVLSLSHSNNLQNSPLDTSGSVTGDPNNGLRITPATLALGGLTGNKNLANVFTTATGGYDGLTNLTLNPVTGVTTSYAADIGNGAGSLNLAKTGAGTQILSGALSHSGTTSVNAGILTLDYSTQDNSKLSDTAALNLGGGTLNLSGGTHAESVLSTTLTAGTASFVTSSGAAPLQMNTITVGNGASVDFGANGIATTDNLNTSKGILGGWATVNGLLAVNSTNSADGLITAAASSDVTRLDSGPQVIPDGSANHIRIIEGTGTAANITLGAATTTVNTLFQTNSGGTSAATIDSGTQTLRANAIIAGAGAGALTIGNGTLSAASAGGDLELSSTSSANAITVNSIIADHTSASSLTKTGGGSATLTGDNTYDGATIVNGGNLFIAHNNALGSTVGSTTVNGGNGTGAHSLSLTPATSDLVIAENINLFGNLAGRAQLSNSSAQNHTFTGAIDVSSDTNLAQFNSSSTGSITVSGDITGTMTNGALLFLRGPSTSATNRVIGSVNLTGGNLAKTDAGTWLVGAAGETYSWVNTIHANGSLIMGAANVLPSTSELTMGENAARTPTLDLNGFSQSTAGIVYGGVSGTATGARTITNSDLVNPAVFTVNNTNDYSSGFTGANTILLTGNLSLKKQGTGKLTLLGANTYSGGTTIDPNSGTLQAAITQTTNALGTGAVSVGSGSTLILDDQSITNTANLPTISNVFTGDGLLKLQFAANTTARTTYLPNVTGFNGTIQLSTLGTTGDKWNATNVGAVAGSLLLDAGTTIFLSAGNTSFTGGITVNGAGNNEGRGAIRLSGATTVLGGNLSLASSSTISMENVGAQITGNISSSVAGAHTLTLGGTGSVGGILSGSISDGTGTVTVTNATGAYTLSGDLSHTGGVNVIGGLLTLSGANNTYTGVTAVSPNSGRSLLVTANDALGATGAGNETTIGALGQLGFSGGINYTATEKVIGSGSGSASAQGVFAVGTRGFIQSVSGSNTFAGDIELSADGTSRIGTQDGASLTLTGAITQSAGVTTANILFRVGNIAGDFVTLSNTGNSFGGDSTVFTAATDGNYAGVRLGVSNALPTNLSISGFSGAGAGTALDMNGKNQSLNGLTNGAQFKIINLDTVTASTLTLNPTEDKTTTNTTILGGAGLGVINVVKEGAFTQTLGGTSTYTGTTQVNQGALVVNGNISTSTSLTVASGATLGGIGTVGPASISGILAPGNGIGTLTANGGVTWNANNAWVYELGTASLDLAAASLGSENDLLNITNAGDFLKGSGSAFTFDFANSGTIGYYKLVDWDGSTSFSASDFAASNLASGLSGDFIVDPTTSALYLNVVPEPTTALLGAIGLIPLLRRRRDSAI